MDERNTLERIHQTATTEFLEKGFQGASLRNIVKSAGVTTGAFYGYYSARKPCSPPWWSHARRRSWAGS